MTQEARIASATKTDAEDVFEEIRRRQATVHRFRETDSHTAILLKLALLASNLTAGRLLIDRSFFYEWTMVRRLICETIEDVMLLLGGIGRSGSSETWGPPGAKRTGNQVISRLLGKTIVRGSCSGRRGSRKRYGGHVQAGFGAHT